MLKPTTLTHLALASVLVLAVSCSDPEGPGTGAPMIGAGGSGAFVDGAGAGGTLVAGEALPSPGSDFDPAPMEVAGQLGGEFAAPVRELRDPGTGPWQPVPADRVAQECLLDPVRLAEADAALGAPWAIVRYGRLCHASNIDAAPGEAWSTTKTLGALVTGMVAYRTRELPRTGPKTGPLSDTDPVSHWLDAMPYNAGAQVAHVLAMVAHNADLAYGRKAMVYDTVGSMQINTLSDMLNAAIAQDGGSLGGDLEQFTQRFLFSPLGMTRSSWSGGAASKNFAYTWNTNVSDMARLGLLILNGGIWNGERLVSEEWIYRMTHPSFEDANTGYGYLTWLNAASNHNFGGIPLAAAGQQQQPMSPGDCAPVSLHTAYPNTVSGAPDCGYSAPHDCDQRYDVGVWQAVGLGGQVIQGHPGLDMVIAAKELTPGGTGPSAPAKLWDAVRAAVIDADPTYAGDAGAFCAAYGSNTYAPDLH